MLNCPSMSVEPSQILTVKGPFSTRQDSPLRARTTAPGALYVQRTEAARIWRRFPVVSPVHLISRHNFPPTGQPQDPFLPSFQPSF
ncbi:hypothetical protein LAZ67_4003681 [Cordylochernes scorpioides]|uniref:Uncharacterized protein n=1 Tax=Cordylochernes scorpioides TaxID=51811 RepID=A0ABY6KE24_9ARAC|nr:hypothetical protein LAZ67_4003681 [Cordylochernes scorpioides]